MTETEILQAKQIGAELVNELVRARGMYPKFNSAHEGYAVLLEEVTELQAEVFRKKASPAQLRKEAVQVGAMAIRFIQDCCSPGSSEKPGAGTEVIDEFSRRLRQAGDALGER